MTAVYDEYWCRLDPPMSFVPEKWSYSKRREFRYSEIDYLVNTVRFESAAGKRVLCVGDGGGLDAAEFAKYGAKVSVLDMSQKAVDLTKSLFLEAGLNLDESVVGDARNLPFSSASFDVVYCFGVIHHIQDAALVVAEACRVLKEGGQYLGMVYNRNSLLYAYSILLRGNENGLTPEEAMRQWSERNPGCPWSEAYSEDELRKLLSCFFKNIDISVHYPVIDLPNKRKVKYETDTHTNLGWHLFFRACM